MSKRYSHIGTKIDASKDTLLDILILIQEHGNYKPNELQLFTRKEEVEPVKESNMSCPLSNVARITKF